MIPPNQNKLECYSVSKKVAYSSPKFSDNSQGVIQVITQDELHALSVALIEELDKRRVEKDISAAEWGRRAFEDAKGAGFQTKIQRYREGNFKALPLSDFILMARALDLDPAVLFSHAMYENKI